MSSRLEEIKRQQLEKRKAKAATAGMVMQNNGGGPSSGPPRPTLPAFPSAPNDPHRNNGSRSSNSSPDNSSTNYNNGHGSSHYNGNGEGVNEGGGGANYRSHAPAPIHHQGSSSSSDDERERTVVPSPAHHEQRGGSIFADDRGYGNQPGSSSSSSSGPTDVERDMAMRGIAPTFDGTPPGAPTEIDWSDVRKGLRQVCPQRETMQCYIKREKGGLLKSRFPTYYLYTTKGDKFLLAAKRRTKNKSSNYVLSTSPTNLERDSEHFFAKVRSNFLGTEFVVYDNGVNPKKVKNGQDTVREELAGIFYETNILGYKGPRQMTVVIPHILQSGLPYVFRPEKPSESIIERAKIKQYNDLIVLKNKNPVWNEKTRSYVLNFSGRVTQPSVKNFQLISPSLETDYVILQFGKTSKDMFNMDFCYPLNALQAFAIALSSFDNKTLVE